MNLHATEKVNSAFQRSGPSSWTNNIQFEKHEAVRSRIGWYIHFTVFLKCYYYSFKIFPCF